jgi:hypothetical protein
MAAATDVKMVAATAGSSALDWAVEMAVEMADALEVYSVAQMAGKLETN